MINHYLGAAQIRERHSILLAEAKTARQARPTRPRRPRARSAPAGTQIVLRDGSHVLVRQVQCGDAPLLADGFADHHDHEALGALVSSEEQDRSAGLELLSLAAG